ncbi:hypothetical protein Pcinc_011489 [Petrolisthes cinctipes]|uniref:Uncharacterized protein n=1 Tax=Petrolisthes cinctipes TaxID=88211 RepID=A0AAE1KUC7_PETCI|nr:hypothetical protein Pcinc_011489 [Petrolisthes cinctipes]
MVRDALIRGLGDTEMQLDVFGDSRQDMSLEEVTKYIEAKESGMRLTSRLLEGNTTMNVAATSCYKCQGKNRIQTQPTTNEPTSKTSSCGHCGKTGHRRSRQERMNKCAAYNHTYKKCGKLHHHENVCRQMSQRH